MSTAIRLTAAFAARYELVARNGVAGEELLEGVFADSVAPLLDGFDGWKDSSEFLIRHQLACGLRKADA